MDPIFATFEGTKEEEKAMFGKGRYSWWPELRKSLGYEQWTKEEEDNFTWLRQKHLTDVGKRLASGTALPEEYIVMPRE
jgi:hypothetical protein